MNQLFGANQPQQQQGGFGAQPTSQPLGFQGQSSGSSFGGGQMGQPQQMFGGFNTPSFGMKSAGQAQSLQLQPQTQQSQLQLQQPSQFSLQGQQQQPHFGMQGQQQQPQFSLQGQQGQLQTTQTPQLQGAAAVPVLQGSAVGSNKEIIDMLKAVEKNIIGRMEQISLGHGGAAEVHVEADHTKGFDGRIKHLEEELHALKKEVVSLRNVTNVQKAEIDALKSQLEINKGIENIDLKGENQENTQQT